MANVAGVADMIRPQDDCRTIHERLDDREGLDGAMRKGVRDALRRHMLLGESVIVADDDGKPMKLSPDEIRQVLDSMDTDPSKPSS